MQAMTDRDQKSQDIAQLQINLKSLRHRLLNGTADIEGCLKQIENYVKSMTEAINICKKSLGND